MDKLRLPFAHATSGVLNKKEVVQLVFNTDTKIDKKTIHNILEKVCEVYNVNYNIVTNYIKDLELQYSKDFLVE